MYYSSKNSRNRYYHHADCIYVRQIAAQNLLELGSIEEAMVRGFKICPHCSVIARLYSKNRKQIDQFCEKHGFVHYICEGEMFVISDQDTAWRICCDEDSENELYLMHESKMMTRKSEEFVPYQFREYHRQHMGPRTILGYLYCIHDHDLYMQNEGEIREKELVQRRREIESIRAVQRQIRRQNRKKRGDREAYTQKRRRSKQQLRALASAFSNYRSAKAANI